MFFCSTCLQMNVVLSLVYTSSSLIFIQKCFKYCLIWFGSIWRNPLVPGTVLSFPYYVLLLIGGQSGASFRKPITWRGNTKTKASTNRSLTSCLSPLFQNESSRKFLFIKMSLICMKKGIFARRLVFEAEAKDILEMARCVQSKLKTTLWLLP